MRIEEVINGIKDYHYGVFRGNIINKDTTRDQILYGDVSRECTGIVTTIYASIDVIKKAHELGCNLIISHEALFWNHGDHQEWLIDTCNKTFLAKKKLLDDYGIVVWRDHDHLHSGIKVNDYYSDGIAYGVMKELGLEKYAKGDKHLPKYFEIPERKASDCAKYLIEKANLNGLKIIGSLDTKVKKILVIDHVLGDVPEAITRIEKEDIDLVIPYEIVDFTLTEYINDSCQNGRDRTVIVPGHFNTEEPGMKYMAVWLKDLFDLKVEFVQAGDIYKYVTK